MPSDTQFTTDIEALLVPFTALDPSIQATTVLGLLFVALRVQPCNLMIQEALQLVIHGPKQIS